MGHIFISYSSKDRSTTRALAKILEKQGLKVWWDKNLEPGKAFDRAISKALDDSESIVVLWSKNSVKSDWVLDEAYEGLERKILVPAMIETTKLPFGYRRIQAINLSRWKGADSAKGIKDLIKSLQALIGPAEESKAKPKKKPKSVKITRRLSGALDGKTIVFTGALSESRKANEEKVNTVGARYVNSVSSKTDYLVVGKEPGDVKLEAAKKHNVKKITEKQWLKMLNEAYKRTLLNKNIVFTGALELPRTTLEKTAKKLGAKPTASISGKTDFLIVGEKPGKSKLDAAKKYDVQIISEELWSDIVQTL
jgi:BRCT domain type II-containing protein